jgi:hypothetical protein
MTRASVVFGSGNPFPETPAARLAGPASETPFGATRSDPPITIDTVSVMGMRDQVADYFTPPGEGQRIRGRALALVGSLGVGKTHLASHVAELIRTEHPSALLWVIDEVVPDLDEVFRGLVTRLRQDDEQRGLLEDVVRDYAADVTAVQMEQRNEDEIAAGLRSRQVDPDKVIEQFNLDDERIYRSMRLHLGAATESFLEFANALALLPERDFADSVWNWLSGNPPLPSLTNRGVTSTIRGTGRVLDTLAMFAFLYGNAGEPCVLIIDSLEKVLDWSQADQMVFLEVFERLVNVYVNLGGLLVFCIQPEPLSKLRSSLHDRISQIWPRGMNAEETRRLVTLHLARHWERSPAVLGGAAPPSPVWPFSEAAIAEIAAISRGNPRQALRLCGEAWWDAREAARTAAGTGEEPEAHIGQEIIHAAARTLYQPAPKARVLELVDRTLQGAQWPTYSRESRAGRYAIRGPERVDFEVAVGRGVRISIAIFDSILTQEDYRQVEETVSEVLSGARPGSRAVLVVVNGYLSRTSRDQISQLVIGQPIVFAEAEFEPRLRRALRETADRLENANRQSARGTGGPLPDQSELLESVNRLGLQLDDVNNSVRRLAGRVPAILADEAEPELPSEVAQHFEPAFEAIRAVGGVDELQVRLGVADNDMTTLAELPRRLEFDKDQVTALGVETLVTRILRAFRTSVANWIGDVGGAGSGVELTEQQRHSLFVMCRSFEITTEVLPLGRLLDRSGALRAHAGYPGSDLPDLLSRLAVEVRKSALAAVDAPR